MDSKQFIEQFGHIARAPGGVQELRNLVLSSAMGGRLVECKSDVDVAKKEFQLIQKRKADSLKINKKAKRKESKFSHKGTSTPNHWICVSLSDLVRVLNGRAYKKQELLVSGTPVLRVGNLFTSTHWYYSDLELDADKYCDKGDLLYAWSASFGPFIWPGQKVIYHYHIWKLDFYCEESINKRYLYFYLLAKTEEIKRSGHGIAMAHMTKAKMETLIVPVPPSEEQTRIVAKVDELMALCDQLEKQQQAKRKLQNQLRQATLQAVATATSPFELKQHWQRLEANFQHLFSQPEDMLGLRRLILELAVAGTLSTWISTDSDVLDVLSSAKSAQKQMLSAREVRELNKLSDFSKSEQNRINVQLGHLIKVISGQHLKPEEYNTTKQGIPYITGPAEFSGNYPSPNKYTEERRAVALCGDILITVKGSGVGKSAVCNLKELAISRQLMALRPLGNLNPDFFQVCIKAFESSFQEMKVGIAIPGIGREEVLFQEISLPSKEEQARIVKRVEELLESCNFLENKLKRSSQLAEKLAIAAIATLTGIQSQQEEAPLKAPQTELHAPVKLGKNTPDKKANAPLAALVSRAKGEIQAKDLWQRFGGEIDTFYAQLKTEIAHGWLAEPKPATMVEHEPQQEAS